MQLQDSFEVALPAEETWALLTDLPRIAPCLPGAHLDEVTDGRYHGGLSTKIGPITANYTGSVEFLERDDIAHRAVIAARGREQRGSGRAQATITATLHPNGTGTRVDLDSTIAISGRAAQFGRSLLTEVSTTMLTEFARRLEDVISGRHPTAASEATADHNTLNITHTMLRPIARRAVLPAAIGMVAGLLGWLIGRASTRRG